MTQCSLKRCRLSLLNHVDLVFFPAPKNKELYDQWMDAIGAENLINEKIDQLCSYHFHSSTFLVENGKKKLNPGTIPTLNLASLLKRAKITAKKEDKPKTVSCIKPAVLNKLVPAILRKLPGYSLAKTQLATLHAKKKVLPSIKFLSALNLQKINDITTKVGGTEQLTKDALVEDFALESKNENSVLRSSKIQEVDSKVGEMLVDIQANTGTRETVELKTDLIDDSHVNHRQTRSKGKLSQFSTKIIESPKKSVIATSNVSITQANKVKRVSGAIKVSNLISRPKNLKDENVETKDVIVIEDNDKNTSGKMQKRKSDEVVNETISPPKLQKIQPKESEQPTLKKSNIDSRTQKALLGILRGGLRDKLFVQFAGTHTTPTKQVQSTATPKNGLPVILNSTIVTGPPPQHKILLPKSNVNMSAPRTIKPAVIDSSNNTSNIDSPPLQPKNVHATPGPVSLVQTMVSTPSKPIMEIIKLDKSVQVKMEDVSMAAAKRKITEQDIAIKTWRDNMAILRKECENHKYYRELHSSELNVADVKLEEARTIIKKQQEKINEFEKKILMLQTTLTELQPPEKEEEPENPKIVYIYNKRKQLSRITYKKKKLFRKININNK